MATKTYRAPRTAPRRRPPEVHRTGLRHRRWRARVGDLLELTALTGLVLVVALFLRDGGSLDLIRGPWPDRMVAVGRVTGLVAVNLLLLQLLLAARLPWVDRVYGNDRALKAHRVLGRVTVPLVLVHVETLVVGYAAREGLSSWTGWAVEPFRMLRDVPDMLTANVATMLLIVIAVTSVRAAIRAVGYERWHLVHVTAYAAVALAVPHQLSTGSDLSASATVRVYWIGLYVMTAGAVIWWRVAVPVVRSLRHRLRVDQVVMEGPETWSVWVSGRARWAVPQLAGPRPRTVGVRPPLVTLPPARRSPVAADRARPRRPLSRSRQVATGYACADRRPVRVVHEPPTDASTGAPDRGRNRRDSGARAPGGDRPRPRRQAR